MLEPDTVARLAKIRTIDLTTIGRRSGRPATVEIWWFHFDDRFIVTGTPGRRDWYANVLSNPTVVVHARTDRSQTMTKYQGVAAVVGDETFRRRFFADRATHWYSTQSELEALVKSAPMIQIDFTSRDGRPSA
jgi:deazaflavin-dependent oxidoreductase (nitroreductase family)